MNIFRSLMAEPREASAVYLGKGSGGSRSLEVLSPRENPAELGKGASLSFDIGLDTGTKWILNLESWASWEVNAKLAVTFNP